MIHVYYAEDDAAIAQTVKEYLEQKGCSVTVFSGAADFRRALRTKLPDIVLIDWNLPDGQGITLCRRLRSDWPELPIIFLTVRGASADIVSGFQNGADDYVVKPFELEVLHSRILALLRRAGQANASILRCDLLSIDTEKMSVRCGQEEVALSQSEYQILLLLMKNKGKTVTRGQLLEQIWDQKGSFVNDNTLTVAIKRLREKLHGPACLKTVRSFGYRMEDTL